MNVLVGFPFIVMYSSWDLRGKKETKDWSWWPQNQNERCVVKITCQRLVSSKRLYFAIFIRCQKWKKNRKIRTWRYWKEKIFYFNKNAESRAECLEDVFVFFLYIFFSILQCVEFKLKTKEILNWPIYVRLRIRKSEFYPLVLVHLTLCR